MYIHIHACHNFRLYCAFIGNNALFFFLYKLCINFRELFIFHFYSWMLCGSRVEINQFSFSFFCGINTTYSCKLWNNCGSCLMHYIIYRIYIINYVLSRMKKLKNASSICFLRHSSFINRRTPDDLGNS